MTVANGCTESEALVAAAKAAELLERYGLSLEELKAAAPDHVCDSDSVNCGRRHTHEAQFLAPKIAEFTKTKIWLSRTRTDVRLTFFGLKADVQIASYLFTVFRTALETEWAIYWASHKEEHPCHGKTVRKSFLMGMITRLNARLSALIEAAKSGPAISESREIIVLKAQIVEKAFRELDLRLEEKTVEPHAPISTPEHTMQGNWPGKKSPLPPERSTAVGKRRSPRWPNFLGTCPKYHARPVGRRARSEGERRLQGSLLRSARITIPRSAMS